MTVRTHALVLFAAFLAAPGALWGRMLQEDPAGYEPAELDAMEARARGAPLFREHEPLRITLRTRVEFLRDERPEEEEVNGTVTYIDPAGEPVTVDVEVRTRGNFRRQKRNCNFPPLRLDFPRTRMDGTIFEGQDKLKLVTPCQDRRDEYQQYVLQEYLAYRVYNLMTPVSYGVRLVEITYEDVDGGYPTRTKVGFLIEEDEMMAHRNRAFVSEWEQFHPAGADAGQLALLALFEYMIGNADWSQPFFHNVDMVRTWDDGRYLVVPYDFDFSGVVDARYAEPDPSLGTESVRDRVYRGFCLEAVDHAAQRRLVQDLRDDVEALYREAPFLDEKERRRSLDYYNDFFGVMSDFRRYSQVILRDCTPLPS